MRKIASLQALSEPVAAPAGSGSALFQMRRAAMRGRLAVMYLFGKIYGCVRPSALARDLRSSLK